MFRVLLSYFIAGVTLSDKGEESIKSIIKKRDEIITESKMFSLLDKGDHERNYTSECAKCPHFNEMTGEGDGLIHYVNINMYPAPCQAKCTYCSVHNSNFGILNKWLHEERYENMLNAIEWAHDNGMIATDAVWQAASGEITIHPYREKIYDLMKDKAAQFLTNCFIFDKKIAAILGANPRSSINLSIDAGTSETWYKVKGVNNFDKVMNNLDKYSASSVHPEQITLKYIILTGINDNLEDYQGVINIMKRLKIEKLVISRDNRTKTEKLIVSHNNRVKDKFYTEQYSPTDKATDDLTAMLKENGMTAEIASFGPLANDKEA
ncbi:radical SAM protein [Paenibacillus sp. BJ-4]|uniref:radical SAM protein n=1 Tax=Paenibacillus sp. BJ-4 TaxID=2878097 RepID=UPI001CF0C503|nr:radical SAM protein [Paenibacillus sp. BJ-4]